MPESIGAPHRRDRDGLGIDADAMFRTINGVEEAVRGRNRFEHLVESGEVLAGFNCVDRRVERRRKDKYVGYDRVADIKPRPGASFCMGATT
jgi:hypothetical protein